MGIKGETEKQNLRWKIRSLCTLQLWLLPFSDDQVGLSTNAWEPCVKA